MVGIGGRVSELPPVVVVPGGVGTHVHTALHRLNWEITDTAVAVERALAHSTL